MSDECIIRCSYVDVAALCGRPASYPLMGSTYCELHIGPLKERVAQMERALHREKLLAHFAAAALEGIVAGDEGKGMSIEDCGFRAYDYARVMLAEHVRVMAEDREHETRSDPLA